MEDLAKMYSVRHQGEHGTFFVHEWQTNYDDGGTRYGAVFCCYSSYGTYGYCWTHMGQPFAQFAAKISEDYLLSKIGRKECSGEKVAKEVRRLICEARRSGEVTKDDAREAISAVDALAEQYTDETLCTMLYESPEVNEVHIEWCDMSTQEYDGNSKQFVRKLWPEFVKCLNGVAV